MSKRKNKTTTNQAQAEVPATTEAPTTEVPTADTPVTTQPVGAALNEPDNDTVQDAPAISALVDLGIRPSDLPDTGKLTELEGRCEVLIQEIECLRTAAREYAAGGFTGRLNQPLNYLGYALTILHAPRNQTPWADRFMARTGIDEVAPQLHIPLPPGQRNPIIEVTAGQRV